MKKNFFFFTLSSFFSLIKSVHAGEFTIPEGTKKFYETGIEKNRLNVKFGRLEKARVENLLDKFLPKTPATIVDVGGGTGAYSCFLAKKGYCVYLIDPVPINIEEARKNGKDLLIKDYILGDARKIPLEDNCADAILFFGPLYHLNEKDRSIALSEAYRVLKPGGIILAQSVSKFATLLNGYFDQKVKTIPEYTERINNCLETGKFEYMEALFFTHTPQELKTEIEKAGFQNISLMSVEGFGKWIDPEFWENELQRQTLLSFIEKTEKEESIIGLSSHIMAIGQKKL
jgi:ubiquinone/menaquinone biosynthesis C-methylase UbiE